MFEADLNLMVIDEDYQVFFKGDEEPSSNCQASYLLSYIYSIGA